MLHSTNITQVVSELGVWALMARQRGGHLEKGCILSYWVKRLADPVIFLQSSPNYLFLLENEFAHYMHSSSLFFWWARGAAGLHSAWWLRKQAEAQPLCKSRVMSLANLWQALAATRQRSPLGPEKTSCVPVHAVRVWLLSLTTWLLGQVEWLDHTRSVLSSGLAPFPWKLVAKSSQDVWQWHGWQIWFWESGTESRFNALSAKQTVFGSAYSEHFFFCLLCFAQGLLFPFNRLFILLAKWNSPKWTQLLLGTLLFWHLGDSRFIDLPKS